MKHARTGSALLIVLCFLGVIAALSQQLVRSSFLAIRLLDQEIKRVQAQILAQNGLTLAMAQLTQNFEQKKNASDTNPKADALEKILRVLNHWQTFSLTKEHDGVQGSMRIYIACEDGKIPIQSLVDPATKKPQKPYFELFKNLHPEAEKKPKDHLPALAAFLQKKETVLEDPSQLRHFFDLPLFQEYALPKKALKKGPSAPPIALFDVFSFWNVTAKINPLFFSKSCATMLKLKTSFAATKDDKDQKEIYHRIAETITKEWTSDWDKNWAALTPLYGAKPQMPAEITALFSTEVEPTVFSVISCGIVQGVEQRLYAIINKRKTAPQTAQPADQKQKNSEKQPQELSTYARPEAVCGIMRMYWIDQFYTEEH